MKTRHILIALLTPLVLGLLQYALWQYIDPYVWFLFFPTVFFVARFTGFLGGMIATIVSAMLVWYVFIPPSFSWHISNMHNIFPIVIFVITGFFFSDSQERLRRANEALHLKLVSVGQENKQISLQYEANLALDSIKFSQLANALPQIVWATTAAGVNIFFNDEWYLYTGMSHEESMGHGWNKPFHPEDQQKAWEAWQNAIVNNAEYSLECRLRRFDGEYRWWLIRGIPAFNSEHEIDKWFGTCTDINDLKSSAEAERAAQAKLIAAIDSISDAIFISDIEGNFINFNKAFATFHKFKSKQECSKTLKEYPLFLDVFLPDGTLARLDQWAVPSALRGETAFDAEFTLKRKDTGESWIGSYNFAPIRNEAGEITGSVVVARDVTEKKRVENELKSYLHRLEVAMEDTMYVLSRAVDMRDPYTSGHQQRVGILAQEIAKKMGMDDKEARNLSLIGLIHDVGKIGVPAEILSKPSKLSQAEMGLVKAHVTIGYDILKNANFIIPVAEIVREHHERMDGSGYPQGLKGEQILMEARIIAVADVVEAMSAHRPYRASLGMDAALAEIEAGRGTKFDPRVVDACLELFRKDGYVFPERIGPV
jgi:PAS domain S-box-containing protein